VEFLVRVVAAVTIAFTLMVGNAIRKRKAANPRDQHGISSQ
jgi:hypothetical protein